MWTVLLVEDEVFVRESLRRLINWEKEGFKIIGEAGNGKEALHIIEEHDPDLVISDILMPEMDGIELLQCVRKAGRDNLFLMLTTHTEFEYARKAIELGASNYILKLSMTLDSLVENLRKVKVELLEKQKKQYAFLEKLYYECWKVINADESNQNLTGELKNFQKKNLVILSSLDVNVDVKNLASSKIIQSDRKLVIHSFSRMGQTTFFCWSEGVVYLNRDANKQPPLMISYSQMTNSTQLIGTWKDVLLQLDDYWYEKTSAPSLRASPGRSFQRKSIPSDYERQIIHLFDQLKGDQCRELIEEIWMYMEENAFTMIEVKEIAQWIDNTIIKLAGLQVSYSDEIANTVTHTSLKERMKEKIVAYMESRIANEWEMTDHPVVNRIIQYIIQHYDEEVSVQLLAEYVSMNKNYLSGLFKRKTGESLIHFLHRVRIKQAQHYLIEDPNLSVSDIGEMVGFINDNYFIKIFKRYHKITPSQYRRQYLP